MAELLDSYVKLLLHCDGVDAATADIDYSGQNHILTFNGNAQLDTAQKVFGPTSLALAVDGDYITSPDHADWDFGSGDFTVDFRIRFASIPISPDIAAMIGQFQGGGQEGWIIYWLADVSRLRFQYSTDGSTDLFSDRTWVFSINTWYHVAIVRNGANLMHFVDGVQLGASHNIGAATIFNSNALLEIGATAGGFAPSGWMDEIRISKGIARWTANFDDPPYAYQTIAKSQVF